MNCNAPLVLIKYGYNLLLHALHKNAANEYGAGLVNTPARALIEKIEQRARLYASSGSGIEYAELPLSGGDAAELIWQLVLYAASLDMPGEDYYARLLAERKAPLRDSLS